MEKKLKHSILTSYLIGAPIGIIFVFVTISLIFDRFGKHLATITSNEIGWNGQHNGKLMMSNDYWFRTDLGNGRTFSGHFSLKR